MRKLLIIHDIKFKKDTYLMLNLESTCKGRPQEKFTLKGHEHA